MDFWRSKGPLVWNFDLGWSPYPSDAPSQQRSGNFAESGNGGVNQPAAMSSVYELSAFEFDMDSLNPDSLLTAVNKPPFQQTRFGTSTPRCQSNASDMFLRNDVLLPTIPPTPDTIRSFEVGDTSLDQSTDYNELLNSDLNTPDILHKITSKRIGSAIGFSLPKTCAAAELASLPKRSRIEQIDERNESSVAVDIQHNPTGEPATHSGNARKHTDTSLASAFYPLAMAQQREAEQPDAIEIIQQDLEEKVSYKCDLCPKDYESKRALQHHEATHHAPGAYRCFVLTCDLTFSSEYHRGRHITWSHGDLTHLKCWHCPQLYPIDRRSALIVHMKSHLPKDAREFPCTWILEDGSQCVKTFVQKQHLDDHVISHTDDKPYQCEHCGLRYARKADLKVHQIEKSHAVLENETETE